MATTFYYRDASGLACGPGSHYALDEALSGSATNITVDSEQTWNIGEARKFQAGAWASQLRLVVGTGSGEASRATLVIEKRDASCGTLQTILSIQSGNLTAGATQNVTFTGSSLTAEFAATDILLARVVRSNGTRTIALVTNDADSYITAPDIATATVGTTIKAWNGTNWVEGELKKYDGSAWDGAVVKRWNGTTWVET